MTMIVIQNGINCLNDSKANTVMKALVKMLKFDDV
jgi:hypothetical protein